MGTARKATSNLLSQPDKGGRKPVGDGGMGRETLSPGGRQEIPLMGFEVVQVREAAVGSGKMQRLADC